MINQEAWALGATRSCIRELFEYGRHRAALVGEDKIYDFSLGNPSIPAPPQVTEAIEQVLAQTDPLSLHGYTSAVGDRNARAAIAEDLNQRFGTDITPEELFLSCGAAPGLCAALKALTCPGEQVLAIAPYFPEYRVFTENAQAEFQAVGPDIPDFQLPLDQLAAALTPKTAVVIVNSPNNPSGAVYTEAALTALAGLLEEKSREFGRRIYILSDEPYRELCYDGTRVPFLPTLYPHTVVCYSYSKSLSLPGERIGYVYVPRQAEQGQKLFLAVAGAARALGHVCAPSLWQRVIEKCVHVRPELTAYDRNRRTLFGGLTRLGYRVVEPKGAFYLFMEAPGGDSQAFSDFARGYDVLLVPGDSFGCPGWLRLSYCVRYETIVNSLPLFEEILQKWNEK